MASLFPPRAADATYADDLGTEFVTILVGPESKKYAVHKKLLTSQSDYFDKALNGGFREAEENSIYLEEEDPAAIALLIGWLYRGVLPGPALLSVHIKGAFPPSTNDTILPGGGTSVPVEFYTEQDPNPGIRSGNSLNRFFCLAAHPRYAKYSPEELRLADYKEGRQFGERMDGGPAFGTSDLRSFMNTPGNFWPPTTTPLVAAGPPQQGLFGSPSQPGGLLSNPPRGGGLFGQPPPTGASLLGPSTVASSGGIFVNLSLPTPTGSQASSSGGFASQPPCLSSNGVFASQPTISTTQAPSSTTSTSGGFYANLSPTRTLPAPATSGAQVTQAASSNVGSLEATQVSQANSLQFASPTLFRSSDSSVSSSSSEGSEPVVTSNPTTQASSVFPIPRGQDGSISVPTRAISNGVLGTRGSSSDDTSQPSTSAASAPGSIPNAQFQVGTESRDLPATDVQVTVSSTTNNLAGAVRSASNHRGDASSTLTSLPAPAVTSSSSTTQDRQIPPPTTSSNPVSGVTGIPSRSRSPPTRSIFRTSPGPYRLSNSQASASPSTSFNYRSFNDVTSQSPFDATYSTYTTPSHQLALLNLAVFAETTCWPTLYNAAITSYIAGERTLARPPPLDHIALIYERTHDESTLRRWAVDSLAAFKGDVNNSGYMGLLVDYEGFLEGVLKKLREGGKHTDEQGPGFDGAGGLRYRMLEHGQKESFEGKSKGKENAHFGGSFDMKDS